MPGNGRIFMLVEAFTVFLALIGTTLSCMNTGARVTYAMGKDEEVPEHFGDAARRRTSRPHRAIWTLAAISAVVGCISVSVLFGDARRPDATPPSRRCRRASGPASAIISHDAMAALPNSLLTITLASNFGTFLLYGLSCIICMVGSTTIRTSTP